MKSNRLSNTLAQFCESEDEKKLLRQALDENSFLIQILKKAVTARIEHSRSVQENVTWFVAPGWASRQANSLGMIRGLKFLLDILS